MEWNFKKDQDVLKCIIALLLAMAGLADRASVSSYPVRRRVLEILLPVETVAQESVLGMARNLGAPIPPQAYLAMCVLMFDDEGEDPADAVRLALRLRILAMALASLAAWTGRSAGRVTVGCGRRRQANGCMVQARPFGGPVEAGRFAKPAARYILGDQSERLIYQHLRPQKV